jgi:hydroxyacid-oxoacid transhydrogenase
MERDIAFEMKTSNLRFGFGATREIGMDLADVGVKNAMVVTDPGLAKSEMVGVLLESIEKEKVKYSLFERAHVEPTDASFKEAIKFAQEGDFDGFVGIGGGTSLDTAKICNLYSTYPPDDFLDYVNAPIGKGKQVPGPLKPLFAIPTTAGTGSETTGVAIFDFKEMKVKTGISHRYLKPTLGVVDPNNTRTLPPAVAASTGLDVLTHAVESFTCIDYRERPRPARPGLRPPYQGTNPISDLWATQAMAMLRDNLPRAYDDPSNDEARAQMMLAASFAGIGFGNAGVHLPHAMAYPIAGLLHEWVPPGYPIDYPLVPHGIAVVVNAPAAFRFTASACPDRHLKAAEVLGADISKAKEADAGKILADQIIKYMQRLKMPNGISELGYKKEHIPELVKGTLAQERLTKLSPKPVGPEELAAMFEDAITYW